MVSSTSSANNLTIENSASSSYSLTVMTVVALIFFPLVLLYQGWSYYVFRARIRGPRQRTTARVIATTTPPTTPTTTSPPATP
jgi:cytochrome d ubiquinol oxidase subunit II